MGVLGSTFDPWQLRRNEADIVREIKSIVGQPTVGTLEYRGKLAQYLGGHLDERGNRVDIDDKVVNERLIQKDFEKRVAEKKTDGHEGGK